MESRLKACFSMDRMLGSLSSLKTRSSLGAGRRRRMTSSTLSASSSDRSPKISRSSIVLGSDSATSLEASFMASSRGTMAISFSEPSSSFSSISGPSSSDPKSSFSSISGDPKSSRSSRSSSPGTGCSSSSPVLINCVGNTPWPASESAASEPKSSSSSASSAIRGACDAASDCDCESPETTGSWMAPPEPEGSAPCELPSGVLSPVRSPPLLEGTRLPVAGL
mmetsp:Transcript_9428/g.26440  ORF Transcript_9428/g.26440 Transcript_9428/m.26440 type:complete len:223 (-) Transcript_9428:156-824(-)